MYITPTTETPDGSVCSNDRISILPRASRGLELYSFDHYDNIDGPSAEDPDNQHTKTGDGLGEQSNDPSGQNSSQRSQHMERTNGDAVSLNVNTCPLCKQSILHVYCILQVT